MPLEQLYEWCEIARAQLTGEDEVGRVIARPFIGEAGGFRRTEARQDYAIDPPEDTLLDRMKSAGLGCGGGRKDRVDLLPSRHDRRAESREQQREHRSNAASARTTGRGLIFTNLVDFDMLYGHRNDVEGYARSLEEFDLRLPEILAAMQNDDLLMISADHGCDPGDVSTDHTREYVPLLCWGRRVRAGVDLGIRSSLADIGQTVAENFGLTLQAGRSFLREIS